MQLFHFLHHFFQVKPLEEDLRFVRHMPASELFQDLPARGRHKGFQKHSSRGNPLDQVPEHSLQTVFLRLILCQSPRHRFIDVFVTAFEQIEDLCDGICHSEVIHLHFHCLRRVLNDCLQVCVHFFCRTLVCHRAAKIFVGHGNRTVHQVSKRICKIRVKTLYHQLPCDHTVILKRHLMKHKVTYCVHAKEINQLIRIEYISFGLAHLPVSL